MDNAIRILKFAEMMSPDKETNLGDACEFASIISYYHGSDDDRKKADEEFYETIRNRTNDRGNSQFHKIMSLGMLHVPDVEEWPSDLLKMEDQDFNKLLAIFGVYNGTNSFEPHYRSVNQSGRCKGIAIKTQSIEWMPRFPKIGEQNVSAMVHGKQIMAGTCTLGIYFIARYDRRHIYGYLRELMRRKKPEEILPVEEWPSDLFDDVPEGDVNKILFAVDAWFEIMSHKKARK